MPGSLAVGRLPGQPTWQRVASCILPDKSSSHHHGSVLSTYNVPGTRQTPQACSGLGAIIPILKVCKERLRGTASEPVLPEAACALGSRPALVASVADIINEPPNGPSGKGLGSKSQPDLRQVLHPLWASVVKLTSKAVRRPNASPCGGQTSFLEGVMPSIDLRTRRVWCVEQTGACLLNLTSVVEADQEVSEGKMRPGKPGPAAHRAQQSTRHTVGAISHLLRGHLAMSGHTVDGHGPARRDC